MRFLELRLDITNSCNLRCVMCHMSYARRRAFNVDLDGFRRLAGGILPSVNVLMLSWGTEPLINPEAARIIEYAASSGVPFISLTTNLNELPGEALDAIVEHVHCVHVSLESADPEVYRSIRRPGRLETVLANLERIGEGRRRTRRPLPWLVFNVVLFRSLLPGLEAVIDLARDRGVREITCAELLPPAGYRRVWAPGPEEAFRDLDRQRVDVSECRSRLEELARYADARGVFFDFPGRSATAPGAWGRLSYYRRKGKRLGFRAKVNLAASYAASMITRRQAACRYPWQQLVVTPEGGVLPCCFWPESEKFGDVATETLEEVWFGAPMTALRRALAKGNLPPTCERCTVSTRRRHGV